MRLQAGRQTYDCRTCIDERWPQCFRKTPGGVTAKGDERAEFHTDAEVWEAAKAATADPDSSVLVELGFYTMLHDICPVPIIDDDTAELVKSIHVCREFGSFPFPGSYSEQPAIWIDALMIVKGIEAELQRAERAKAMSQHG